MPQSTSANSPLYLRVNEAVEASRISRTRMYELISSGKIKTAKNGRTRLISAESLKYYLSSIEA